MYTIGQFAAVTKLPARTLRFYDSIDLLKPALVDEDNGYRYYNEKSLLIARQILIFRECGMSLKSIGKIIDKNESSEDIVTVLKGHLNTLDDRLKELEYSRSKFEKIFSAYQNSEAEEIVVQKRDSLKVISVRERGDHSTISSMLSRIFETAAVKHIEITGPHTIVYHEPKDLEAEDHDMEIYVPVEENSEDCGLIKVIPSKQFCKLIHRGSMSMLAESYNKVLSYIDKKGLKITGPFEEIYTVGGKFFKPSSLKIEIAIPVGEDHE